MGQIKKTAPFTNLILLRLFYFCIFLKKILQKYIFGFRFYRSIPLPPGRGAAGGLPPVCRAGGPLLPPCQAVATYM